MSEITPETIALNQTDCDKCCGTGFVFQRSVYELIGRWRSSLGIPAKTLAALAKIPYTSYCKFEKGTVVFSEARVRLLVQMLIYIQTERKI